MQPFTYIPTHHGVLPDRGSKIIRVKDYSLEPLSQNNSFLIYVVLSSILTMTKKKKVYLGQKIGGRNRVVAITTACAVLKSLGLVCRRYLEKFGVLS